MYRDAIAMFVATAPKDAKLQPLAPSDWEAIELVEEWLRLFREATTLMSTTSGVTLSTVHSTFRELQDHVRDALKSMPVTAPGSLKQGLINAHTKLSDYYLVYDASPYYIWAAREFSLIAGLTVSLTSYLAVLDPWINLTGLLRDCEQDDDLAIVEEQIRHVHDGKAQLERHFKKYYLSCGTNAAGVNPDPDSMHASSPAHTAGSSTTTDAPGLPQRRQFLGKARYQKPGPLASAPAGPVDELAAYLRLDAPSEDCPFDDPLKWWQSKAKTFPHLARLARDIFSIPGMLETHH